jgi:hypothetical protein
VTRNRPPSPKFESLRYGQDCTSSSAVRLLAAGPVCGSLILKLKTTHRDLVTAAWDSRPSPPGRVPRRGWLNPVINHNFPFQCRTLILLATRAGGRLRLTRSDAPFPQVFFSRVVGIFSGKNGEKLFKFHHWSNDRPGPR